ncbi:MAG TPA: DsbA family protein [Gemmatimonadaceae bacterium]|nr:DsbA family protein [Gemmatimonadaceae bacterium]
MSREWMQRQLDRAIMVALVACLVLGGGLALQSYRRRSAVPPATPPTLVANWRQLAEVGNVMGPATAPVTILELSDFQCPFCSQAAASIARLRRHYGAQIKVVFRHYPLTGLHPFAYAAAVASECAAEQGRFEPFHDAVFGNQDSIGKWSWSTVARRAGVADTTAFEACRGDATSAAQARVERDVATGHALGMTGTPTVIVQGLKFPGAPSYAVLDSLTKLVLAGHALTAPEPRAVASR